MIRRVWLLYRIEVTKALYRRQSYLGPVLLLALVLISTILHPIARDGVADYGFIAYVTPLGLGFLGHLMLLVFCASLVSPEMERGALRGALTRPVTRGDFLTAKLLLGFTYALLLTAVVAVSSWAVAGIQGDLLGVHIGGELVFTSSQMFWSYLGGAALSLLPQFAGASVAILFSTICKNASTAIGLSIGTWLIADLVKYPLNIAPYLFSTYLEASWQVFSHRCDALSLGWFPMAWQCALSSTVVIAGAFGLSLAIFRRRNLGSC